MASVGQRTKQIVQTNLDKFAEQWPSWDWLQTTLKAAGLEVTSPRELRTNGVRRSSWLLLAKPESALVTHFDLAPEVLVLCSPWDVMQANDIQCAEDVFNEGRRVDIGFVVVITGDEEAESRLLPVLPDGRRYIFIPHRSLAEVNDPQTFLRNLLRDALGRRRLFDWRFPAASTQFFGRERELEGLERDILLGHCIGLFGLRKVGKTSLLRRVAEKFRSTAKALRVVPIEVDLQELSFRQRNLEGLGVLIGQKLDRNLEALNIQIPNAPRDPFDRFKLAILHVERNLGARILLILDEYEVLLDGQRIPSLDGLELLRWIRGLAQSYPREFSFILAGRNAMLLNPARIDGRDNPMYRFLKTLLVAGLAPEDCRTMVRKIGRRLGLQFMSNALDIVVERTGGHPALARAFGDLVDQTIPIANRQPATVNATLVMQLLPRFSRDRAVDGDMRELVNASIDVDPRAEEYLVHAAHELPWIGGPTEAGIHDALVDYGIMDANSQFRIGQLQIWLRDNYTKPLKAAHG